MNKIYIEVFYASILSSERNMSEFGLKLQHKKDQKGIVTIAF